MRLAVLADIHGNLPALEAVLADLDAWHPERVVVAGDIVNRGPLSRDCLARILERCARDGSWRVTRGNHEEYVLAAGAPDRPSAGAESEVFRGASWTLGTLTEGQRVALGSLPERVEPLPGGEVVVTHASVRSTADGIFPWSTEPELREQVELRSTLFVVGHTHCPLQTRVEGTQVVNVGSVGLPFDGDPRASYGRFTRRGGVWRAEIRRLPYDRDRALRDFEESGYLDGGGPLARVVRSELAHAESRLFQWMERYFARVRAGAIGVAEAVDEFLA